MVSVEYQSISSFFASHKKMQMRRKKLCCQSMAVLGAEKTSQTKELFETVPLVDESSSKEEVVTALSLYWQQVCQQQNQAPAILAMELSS
jgi:hypothetical protein